MLDKNIIDKRDKKAFEQLFFEYYDYLYGFAYSYLKNKEEAEELVSDVFLTIWRKRESLPDIHNLKVYLYVSVRNQAINYIKKHKKASFFSIYDLPFDTMDQDESPEAQVLTKELITEIDEAMEELPPRCKEVFQLVRMDGLRYKEVAEMLKISVKTVENQVGIAVQKIGARLALHLQGQTRRRLIKWRSGTLTITSLIFLFF